MMCCQPDVYMCVCLQALSQWMTDWAVLPVENSLGGSIHTVYDLLLRYRLHIVGETSVAVNHCLLALPGTQVTDLKRVISHPQVGSLSRSCMLRVYVWRAGKQAHKPSAGHDSTTILSPLSVQYSRQQHLINTVCSSTSTPEVETVPCPV